MQKIFLVLLMGLVLVFSVCTSTDTLALYQPVTDPKFTDPTKFQSDVTECREIAFKLQKEYQKRRTDETLAAIVNIASGAVVGGAIGNAIGGTGSWTTAGAATGAAVSGIDHTHDLVKYGPRRVVDRCMSNRGHKILSDPGKGA